MTRRAARMSLGSRVQRRARTKLHNKRLNKLKGVERIKRMEGKRPRPAGLVSKLVAA